MGELYSVPRGRARVSLQQRRRTRATNQALDIFQDKTSMDRILSPASPLKILPRHQQFSSADTEQLTLPVLVIYPKCTNGRQTGRAGSLVPAAAATLHVLTRSVGGGP